METIRLVFITNLVLTLFVFQAFSQSSPDISKYNSFVAPVQYSNDGLKTDGLLLFINLKDPEISGMQYSHAYLLNKSGQNLQLAGDSNAFYSVYEIKVSKDSKYVATYCVGEGHPWIEIYDLQKLIDIQNQDLVASINPYPGNVYLIGWQNKLLIVESDINLLLKNEGKDLSETDFLKKSRKYSFDMESKKFMEYK